MKSSVFNCADTIKRRTEQAIKIFAWILIIYIVSLICGFLSGIFCDKESDIYVIFGAYTENYFLLVFGSLEKTFGIFLIRLSCNIGYFILAFITGLSVWLIPVNILIFIYRGFVLGLSMIISVRFFSTSGLVVFLFLIFPQHIITSACLVLSGVCCVENQKSKKSCSFCKKNDYWKCVLTFFLLSLIGAIFEFLILALLIRPLHFYF